MANAPWSTNQQLVTAACMAIHKYRQPSKQYSRERNLLLLHVFLVHDECLSEAAGCSHISAACSHACPSSSSTQAAPQGPKPGAPTPQAIMDEVCSHLADLDFHRLHRLAKLARDPLEQFVWHMPVVVGEMTWDAAVLHR